MIRVPLGLIFQASRAVSAGIGAIGCGYIDMASLLVLVCTRLLLSYNYFSHSPAESCGGTARTHSRPGEPPQAANTVQIRARVEKRPLSSLARASLTTTSQSRQVCQAAGSCEASP